MPPLLQSLNGVSNVSRQAYGLTSNVRNANKLVGSTVLAKPNDARNLYACGIASMGRVSYTKQMVSFTAQSCPERDLFTKTRT